MDSTIKRKRVFRFLEVKAMYVSADFNGDIFNELQQWFYKLDFIGKFSFFTVNSKIRSLMSTDVIGGAIHLAIKAVADNSIHATNELWYFNSKGKLLRATSQAIGYLLRNDNDFHEEFEKEKKFTDAVYRKYLIMMNGRYPY